MTLQEKQHNQKNNNDKSINDNIQQVKIEHGDSFKITMENVFL